jgi:hypothetical protein
MLTRVHRGGLAALMVVVLATFGLVMAPTANAADTIVPVNFTVNASTHLKSLNLDVTVPPGSFTGQVDLTTGALTGTLKLPPATQSISILGIPLASATFSLGSSSPVTGTLNLAAGTVSVTASFSFNIASASASILPKLNLVGNNCHGSKAITQTLSGPFSLTGANTFSSMFTIPKLADCGPLTPILNLIIPSSGNTFTVSFSPATTS